MFQDTKEGL